LSFFCCTFLIQASQAPIIGGADYGCRALNWGERQSITVAAAVVVAAVVVVVAAAAAAAVVVVVAAVAVVVAAAIVAAAVVPGSVCTQEPGGHIQLSCSFSCVCNKYFTVIMQSTLAESSCVLGGVLSSGI